MLAALGRVRWQQAVVWCYGTKHTKELASLVCLWPTVFGAQPVQVVLVRPVGAPDGYELALVSTDRKATPAKLVQRYAARWSPGCNSEKEVMMRVFVAGASGAIGARLVPQLVERGHEVIGTCRSPQRARRLHALGAEPIVLDLLDPPAVRKAILDTKPDAIVHQATALAGLSDFKHFDRSFAQTNRLRTDGTDALLAAAREANVTRFVAQSFANHMYARQGGPVKTEDDPLDPTPVPAMRETNAATRHLEEAVTDAGGIALRYGNFYGDSDDALVEAVRTRSFPIVGGGGGVWSFVHLDDAAAATVLALDHDGPGIYNVVDDEPAPTRVWLPEFASIVGAKPPQRFPRLLARLFAGEAPVAMGTESRGASNAKAKRELGWILRYPSWRQGFVHAYR